MSAQLGSTVTIEQVERIVTSIWHNDIVGTINDILFADHFLGFKHFEAHANPSIDEIASSLNVVDAAISSMLGTPGINDNIQSALLNCQQCVHLMRRLIASLRQKNNQEYADVIQKLKAHAGPAARQLM